MGFRVALVSDAGTPAISDPGYKFLKEAKKQGISIEALPGPCAATTALSACGFPTERFQFYGYLSKTDSDRETSLLEISRSASTTVLYESPNRLLRTLATIEEIFGANHEVYIGVELTKMHERHYRDTVIKVRQQIEEESEGSRFKGEVTIVVAPFESVESENERLLKSGGFDPKRDAHVKVNLISIAKKLNESVDMSEHEFRELMISVFD